MTALDTSVTAKDGGLRSLPVPFRTVMAKPIAIPASTPFILRDIAARWARSVVVINPVGSRFFHLIDGIKVRHCGHEDTPFHYRHTAGSKGRLDLEPLHSEDSLVTRRSPADDHTQLAGLTREGWFRPLPNHFTGRKCDSGATGSRFSSVPADPRSASTFSAVALNGRLGAPSIISFR